MIYYIRLEGRDHAPDYVVEATTLHSAILEVEKFFPDGVKQVHVSISPAKIVRGT